MDAAQLVPLSLRGTVFIRKNGAMTKGDHRSYRVPAITCDAYLEGVAEALDQVPEPGEWLRRQSVAASREHQQTIELPEHVGGAADLVRHALALSAKNFPLCRALMELVEQVLGLAPQVQRMQQELVRNLEARAAAEALIGRPQFDVSPLWTRTLLLKIRTKRGELIVTVQQRVAVIGEWQRDEPRSGEPASDLTEYDCVVEFGPGRAGRKCDWPISVGTRERVKPRPCVKHRGTRVVRHECRPSRILQRVETVNAETAFPVQFGAPTLTNSPIWSTIRRCWSGLNPGNIGSERISAAARSLTGSDPGPGLHS